ncbi:fimbrial protein [Pseudomonas sp. BGI-2]|uniref:fimbrial protein n=1 Tax=Pseudomonas sp. BGI-2 TaxID=2528211 RepID=UPI00103447EB|nr:fimbrial protein [Pseudomonas sp. BGI-2]TBN40716.1 type 1 fimbrial protein [Pseudomonas sp. BGI-2]
MTTLRNLSTTKYLYYYLAATINYTGFKLRMSNSRKKLLLALTVNIFTLFSNPSFATCTSSSNAWPTFDVGANYVPRNAPVGSVIGVYHRSFHHSQDLYCKKNDTFEVLINGSVVSGITMPSVDDGDYNIKATIVKTNIPGVGIIVRSQGLLGAASVFETIPSNFPYPPFNLKAKGAFGIPPGWWTEFTLVKISNDIPMGASNLTSPYSIVKYMSNGENVTSIFVTGSVVRSECSLPASARIIKVPMGNIERRQFKGKGSKTETNEFQIPLTDCTAGTYPNQSWNFYQNSNATLLLESAKGSTMIDPANGILGLTSDSTAKGVAVQVLHKDGITPMPLGIPTPITKVKDGSMSLILKARYIQTSDSATGPEPGIANASANFTLTYK